jgi:hypothetical protein
LAAQPGAVKLLLAVQPEPAVPLAFLRQAAEQQFELAAREQSARRPGSAERPAAQRALELPEELPRALQQSEELQASAGRPQLPSSA